VRNNAAALFVVAGEGTPADRPQSRFTSTAGRPTLRSLRRCPSQRTTLPRGNQQGDGFLTIMPNLGNAWHLPASPEPRGCGAMRDPIGPLVPGADVTCQRLRDNTVDEILTIYERLCAKKPCPSGADNGGYEDNSGKGGGGYRGDSGSGEDNGGYGRRGRYGGETDDDERERNYGERGRDYDEPGYRRRNRDAEYHSFGGSGTALPRCTQTRCLKLRINSAATTAAM